MYPGCVGDARRSLGQAAEEAAAAHLHRAGLRVVERNVRFAMGEIDLVCRDGDAWVFVEVKCRRTWRSDGPAAAVSWHKQDRLTRLATLYLSRRRLGTPRCRFDVVAVAVDAAGRTTVEHLRDAFPATRT